MRQVCQELVSSSVTVEWGNLFPKHKNINMYFTDIYIQSFAFNHILPCYDY